MTRITIPFRPHFRDAMIQGRKTVTSRPKKYGAPGDEFEAFGFVFVIGAQKRMRLEVVANELYAVEGFEFSMEFRKEWRSIHPIKGFDPEQRVWVHWFHRKSGRHIVPNRMTQRQLEFYDTLSDHEWTTVNDRKPGEECACEIREMGNG